MEPIVVTEAVPPPQPAQRSKYRGTRFARPAVAFALLLLIIAAVLGILCTFTHHWVESDKWFTGFVIPNENGARIKYRVGIWEVCYEVGWKDFCEDIRSLVQSLDTGVPNADDDFAWGLIHSTRAVRAFMIIGDVLAIIAAAGALVVLFRQHQDWRHFRAGRLACAALAFLAFICFMIAFIIYAVSAQHKYTDDDTPATIELKCEDHCNFSYSFWLTLVAFILCLLAAIALLVAGEPLYQFYHAPPTTVVTTTTPMVAPPPPTPIYAPPPPMVVQQSPINLAPMPAMQAYSTAPVYVS